MGIRVDIVATKGFSTPCFKLTCVLCISVDGGAGLDTITAGTGVHAAQFAPTSVKSGDALWHLPRFGEQGWFLHANNGRVRACNMDKVSVVGERAAPRCSKWTVD